MGSTSAASLKSSDLAVDILSENYDLSKFDCEDPDYNDFIKNYQMKGMGNKENPHFSEVG